MSSKQVSALNITHCIYQLQNNNATYRRISLRFLFQPAEIEVISTNDNKSLHDILLELNTKINHTEISKFNISRGHLWEGAVRGLSRKSFSPANRVSVKFTDDVGNAEGAVDSAGPTREFFTLVIEWIVNSQLFCGDERE